MILERPKNTAESVANCNEIYRLFKERMRFGGQSQTIPKYKAFSKLFHTHVAVCGDAMGYEQNACNALAVITYLAIKYDQESATLAKINPDPVFEFVAQSIVVLNRMAREAKKKEAVHVLFGPFSKN